MTVARYREWVTEQKLLPGASARPAALAALLQPKPTERPAHEQSPHAPDRTEQRLHRQTPPMISDGTAPSVFAINASLPWSPALGRGTWSRPANGRGSPAWARCAITSTATASLRPGLEPLSELGTWPKTKAPIAVAIEGRPWRRFDGGSPAFTAPARTGRRGPARSCVGVHAGPVQRAGAGQRSPTCGPARRDPGAGPRPATTRSEAPRSAAT